MLLYAKILIHDVLKTLWVRQTLIHQFILLVCAYIPPSVCHFIRPNKKDVSQLILLPAHADLYGLQCIPIHTAEKSDPMQDDAAFRIKDEVSDPIKDSLWGWEGGDATDRMPQAGLWDWIPFRTVCGSWTPKEQIKRALSDPIQVGCHRL